MTADCQLTVEVKDDARWTLPCDGCRRDLAEGERYIWGIDSCCRGGCSRSLCADCVRRADEMLRGSDKVYLVEVEYDYSSPHVVAAFRSRTKAELWADFGERFLGYDVAFANEARLS